MDSEGASMSALRELCELIARETARLCGRAPDCVMLEPDTFRAVLRDAEAMGQYLTLDADKDAELKVMGVPIRVKRNAREDRPDRWRAAITRPSPLLEKLKAAAAQAERLTTGVFATSPPAPPPATKELTETDKALHRAIGLPRKDDKRMGAAEWMEPLLNLDRATAPAKSWRNKWLTLAPCLTSAGVADTDTVLISQETWPSKEVAEQAAIDAPQMRVDLGLVRYLGAFPADEI